MSLARHCTPRSSVFDRNRRDVVLDLSDFLDDRIEGEVFFAENYMTGGMRALVENSFARLSSAGDRSSLCVLSEAMGGGKTHTMIALGLLAREPALRTRVLGDQGPGHRLGSVRVIGFHGRQTDAPFGIWGELARQLGRQDCLRDYYQPLQPPGQSA